MTGAAACRMRSLGLALTLALCAAATSAVEASDAGGDKGGDLAPLASSLSPAEDAEAAVPNGITLTLSRGASGITLEGRFSTAAPSSVAWNVLTDYDGIAHFVTSMRSSHVVGRSDDTVFVDQQAVGRLFLFSHRLHTSLRIEEQPPVRIRFEDLLGRDFHSYRGEWRIVPAAGGATIVYHLEADPSFPIPDFVARGLFRGAGRDLLSQVRAEIERRAALASR